MNQINNKIRFLRLIESACIDMRLDLTGLTVLTEAASGPFICTSLAAAKAGANVIAITRSSQYGYDDEIIKHGNVLANYFGVIDKIKFSSHNASRFAEEADIVTNLGFVRPITYDLIEKLPAHAVIPLMWEPWELRADDIDIDACKHFEIPVIGTNEEHPRLKTFDYVGAVAIKLLMENEIEVYSARIGIIASNPFGNAIEKLLTGVGASIVRIDLPLDHLKIDKCLKKLDGIILAEHKKRDELIGNRGGIRPDSIKNAGVCIVHIAGVVDDNAMDQADIRKSPPQRVKPGYMTVTTSYAGPKPVVDLHCAGLRVAEIAVRRRIAGGTVREAIEESEASGFGLRVPGWL